MYMGTDNTCVWCTDVGTYAPPGSTATDGCVPCAAGKLDHDHDPTTPCQACIPGRFGNATGGVGPVPVVGTPNPLGTLCDPCPAGTRAQREGMAACDACGTGQYAGIGSSTCDSCYAGRVDHDDDPTTPCEDCPIGSYAGCGVTTCDICTAGQSDADADPSTPCTPCAAGDEWSVPRWELTLQTGTAGVNESGFAAQFEADLKSQLTACLVPVWYQSTGQNTGISRTTTATGNALWQFTPEVAAQRQYWTDLIASTSVAVDGFRAGNTVECLSVWPSYLGLDTFGWAGWPACTMVAFRLQLGDGSVFPAADVASQSSAPDAGGGMIHVANGCTVSLDTAFTVPAGDFSSIAPVLNSAASCNPCAAGRADHDAHSTSACEHCSAGEYAAVGASTCILCTSVGQVDIDSDPATPCISLGTAALASTVSLDLDISAISDPVSRANFDAAFKADMAVVLQVDQARIQVEGVTGGSLIVAFAVLPANDGTSYSPIELESRFSTSAVTLAGASALSLSEITSSTVDMAGCLQVCLQGSEDADCSDPAGGIATPCTPCAEGKYSSGGTWPSSQCMPCAPGSYAPEGALANDCLGCAQGTADTDSNSWTACVTCAPGTIAAEKNVSSGLSQRNTLSGYLALANATRCHECPPGRFFRGSEGNEPFQDCFDCPVGRFNDQPRSFSEDDCRACDAGMWAFLSGSSRCEPCPVNSYRRSIDDGCQPCSDDAYSCGEPGLVVPKAAPGHFVVQDRVVRATGQSHLELSVADLREEYYECTPFTACLGMCDAIDLQLGIETNGDEVDAEEDSTVPNYEKCLGGTGEESCTVGYMGDRCSSCIVFDPDIDMDDCTDNTEANGYYRMNDECMPCPCTYWTAGRIAMAGVVLAVLFLLISEELLRHVGHISSIVAPATIIVTFYQTIGLLLDLKVVWPPMLKNMLVFLTIFNVNIEFSKPECSGTFGAYEKLLFTLMLPFVALACLGLYALIQYARVQRLSTGEYEQRHAGKTFISVLSQQLLGLVTALFTFGSIFFLRRVLMTWNCTMPTIPGGPQFLIVEPEVECSDTFVMDNGHSYSTLSYWSMLGVVVYVAMFVSFTLGLFFKRDLFQILGDRFEARFFYWEMMLVSRKVLIMMSLLFFGEVMETAWFMASTVIITSVLLHTWARPYEDQLIDWCEFLSLIATLFIYMSTVVFKVFNDPTNPASGDQALRLKDSLELVSMLLIVLNTLVGAVINVRIAQIILNHENEEDYRVKLIRHHVKEAEEDLAELQEVYKHAEAEAEEKAESKKQHQLEQQARTGSSTFDKEGSDMEETSNPLDMSDVEDGEDPTDPEIE
jgi:hypothetical protein